jgi:hypothetical protein
MRFRAARRRLLARESVWKFARYLRYRLVPQRDGGAVISPKPDSHERAAQPSAASMPAMPARD